MSQAIFSLPYFGPISFYAKLVKYDHIAIEAAENYQKQSHRSRQYIYGANGKLMLNIPVKHSKSSSRLKYKESKIENEFKWQLLHFRSLEAAYRTSPYFEFYEADIEPLYTKKYEYLFDYNLDCFKTIFRLLDLDLQFKLNSEYKSDYEKIEDNRHLVKAKKSISITQKPYHQVFEDKFGFIENLSILDLLFNLGPEALSYLKSIDEFRS